MTRMSKPDLFNPIHFIAFGFGSGLVPKAPGTAGTLAAIPFFYLMSFLNNTYYLIVLSIVILSGIWICQKTSDDLGVHDHPGIVWDEFAGYFVTMIAVPVNWQSVILGFLLFRLFDIFKPWPINWLDSKVSGGLGIMLDDIIAGLFALGMLQLFLNFGWLT